MKINIDIKTDIQCFVYFLFSGALIDSNSKNRTEYLEHLLKDPTLLYNCFEVFAYSMQNENSLPPNGAVCEYIEQIMAGNEPELNQIIYHNKQLLNYWNDFLDLAHKFCFNELQESGIKIDLKSLKGTGTDAVPIFAVWTNIIEVDSEYRITNAEYAINRLLQRFNLDRHGKYIPKFEDWEIEQEIY